MKNISHSVITLTVFIALLVPVTPAQAKGKQLPLSKERCLLAVYYTTAALSRVKKLPPKFSILKKLCDGNIEDLRQHGYQAVKAKNHEHFPTLFGQRPGRIK